METILLSTSAGDLEQAAALIKSGGLVAIPTETVYGLGANGLDPAAVEKIFLAKGRPQDNPLILHIASADALPLYCREIPDTARALAERFWPGPLTMVLPVADVVPKVTVAGHDTVAIRCPANDAAREIIRLAGVPIAAPSANRSGKPSTTSAAHVLHDMDGRIDAVVDGGASRVGVESTIIDLTETPPRLLRPGGVTPEQLREVLGEITVDKAVVAQISDDTVVRAPGMKYKHYAPSAEVVIVAGAREDAADYIRRAFRPGNAVLCFAEELPLYAGLNALAYGREAAPETLSAGLFDALRQLDRPEITRIYARCPEGGGIAWAVQNRLRKSAGFHIVNSSERAENSSERAEEKPAALAACRIIGVTGPSGAGKTTALNVLRELGATVFDCDAIYHELLKNDPALTAEIEAAFPGTVADGVLDRKALGARVFSDPAALQRLNAVTHPRVKRELLRRMERSEARFFAIDAIGLFEGGLAELCDLTVAVVAPEEARLQRLTVRDGISGQAARARINAQKSAAEFEALCDVTLHNDGSPEEFQKTCESCFRSYIANI